MKNTAKKIVSLLAVIACIAAMAVGLTACSSTAKYKIGILLYNFTDIQGKQVKDYTEYLAKGFDVEFTYVSVGTDDDAHVAAVESCINQGCNAIFSGYNTAIDTCVAKCAEADVYYGLFLSDTVTTELTEETLTSKYYLGGVKQFSGDPSQVGALFAEVINQSEYTKIAGISFPPFAFVDGNTLWNKLVEDADDTKTIYNAGNEAMPIPFGYNGDYYYFMFTSDACQAEVDKMFTEHPDIEVIVGMGSGMDYILPALRNSNHSSVKMLALGYTDQVESYLQDGTLLAAGTNNYVQCVASLFARAYDAMESGGTAWYTDRMAVTEEYYQYAACDGAADYTTLTSVDDVTDFKTYIIGDKANGPITNEELKQCMLSFNEDATWAALNELTTRTLAEVKAARG